MERDRISAGPVQPSFEWRKYEKRLEGKPFHPSQSPSNPTLIWWSTIGNEMGALQTAELLKGFYNFTLIPSEMRHQGRKFISAKTLPELGYFTPKELLSYESLKLQPSSCLTCFCPCLHHLNPGQHLLVCSSWWFFWVFQGLGLLSPPSVPAFPPFSLPLCQLLLWEKPIFPRVFANLWEGNCWLRVAAPKAIKICSICMK